LTASAICICLVAVRWQEMRPTAQSTSSLGALWAEGELPQAVPHQAVLPAGCVPGGRAPGKPCPWRDLPTPRRLPPTSVLSLSLISESSLLDTMGPRYGRWIWNKLFF
jgi:hypothetical protein